MKTPKLSDVLGIINKIAPPHMAETWDNSGLQLGDPKAEVSRIMVALDPTIEVVRAAISASCQLLVTHHPLIFKPMKSVSAEMPAGKLIFEAIAGGLAVISIHTSYDIADNGLNDLLAVRLGLSGCKPLQQTDSQELVKLAVFVPDDYLDILRNALLSYAETLGNYKECSFASPGLGTFTPLPGASPTIGKTGTREAVSEHRLEILLDRRHLPSAIKRLLKVHPYEEPAFDIYPLMNKGKCSGLGRIGTISRQMSLSAFAAETAEILKSPGLRYSGDPNKKISKVAVCSGSGASLLRDASLNGADAFITGDVKYHDARDAQELGIALIDAGHFSTEIIMVEGVSGQLGDILTKEGYDACRIIPCTLESDPFNYLNSRPQTNNQEEAK